MKVMVTGALGNVGKFVVESLIELKEKVVAADISLERLESTFGNNKEVTSVYFDFTNVNTFEKAFEDVDRVFLMRPPHLGKPEDLLPFIEAMAKKKIKLVSFLSLMGVEKNPIPPHHKIEKFIERCNLPYAHVRPGFFMQNVSGIHAKEIKEQNQIFVPAGKSKTSFIDAADIGLAVATVLHNYKSHLNKAYTITGSEALNYYEVAKIISKVTDKKITYAKPSFFRFRSHYIKERELDKGYVNVMVMLYFMTRMGTAKAVTNDFEKLTGKKPRSFQEFVKDNIEFFI